MSLRCMLVPTGPGLDPTRRLEAARRLCRRLHAHIGLCFVAPGPEDVLAGIASLAPVDGTTLTRIGRLNDLVVVDRPDPREPFTGRALDAAPFPVGRPTPMVGGAVPHDLPDHVVIAWKGSLEATRLVGRSIALLHAATRITVVQVRTGRPDAAPAEDLHGYLRWHGVRAEPVTATARDGASAGEAILAEAGRRAAGAGRLHAQPRARVSARGASRATSWRTPASPCS